MNRTREMMTRITIGTLAVLLFSFVIVAQDPKETPPPPADPRPVSIPGVHETKLPNGLTVVTVTKRGLPLVTASVLVKAGAEMENASHAGLASLTAEMLTKGTPLRSATQIAEEMEFLGASINTDAGWNSSTVTISVMRDKLPKAMALMADSVTRPTFPANELNLVKKQSIDGLSVGLKQPGTVLAYVASRFTYGEHSVNGTPESVARIRTRDVETFHHAHYRPQNSVLVFAGDITPEQAAGYARLFFGGWEKGGVEVDHCVSDIKDGAGDDVLPEQVVGRMLVIDLPDSGQAAVGYARKLAEGRAGCGASGESSSTDIYLPATVLNSVLGGGYSARLNQEIRIKRGLSYGARSGFSWRWDDTNFNANTQTKNESAAEVAELIKIEIEKLAESNVDTLELIPRKAVVTGGFGRGLQTNNGLAARIRDLYLYDLDPDELNSFIGDVVAVTGDEIKDFAAGNLLGGDMIIVGDSKLFIDDLTKRFPNRTIEVIRSADLDLNSPELRKKGRR